MDAQNKETKKKPVAQGQAIISAFHGGDISYLTWKDLSPCHFWQK